MGEEIGVFEGSYKITEGLLKEFGPRRVRDTPIAEEGFVGAAIGAAMLGLRPVVEIMTINFSLLALDQIVNHAAKIYGMFGGQCSVPMVIRTPGGGGQQLGATHSQNVELFYSFIPGLKVLAPSTPGRGVGDAEGRDPRRRPGAVPGEPRAVQHARRGARRAGAGRDRPGRRHPRGHRHHDHRLLADGARRRPRSPSSSPPRASPPRSSTCAACGRWTGRPSSPPSAVRAAP